MPPPPPPPITDGSKKPMSDRVKEVPLFATFDEKHILKLFPLSSCQNVNTIPEKNCLLPTSQKWTFCKGLCGENG